MCLALPGKVIRVDGATARVDFGGIERAVHIQLLPALKVGQYVLTHAGFAIQILDLEEAEKTLALLSGAFGPAERDDGGVEG